MSTKEPTYTIHIKDCYFRRLCFAQAVEKMRALVDAGVIVVEVECD